MSDGPELKPCPFCGKAPESHIFNSGFGGMQVDCQTLNCPASQMTSVDSLSDPIIAFKAWNTRADLPTTNAQIMADPRVKALIQAGKNALLLRDPLWFQDMEDAIAQLKEYKPCTDS